MAAQTTPDTRENTGHSKDGFIRMDAERTRRFAHALGNLHEEIITLATAGKCFPPVDVAEGIMSPELTVRAFTKSMSERLYLLWAMMNCEEAAEQEGE